MITDNNGNGCDCYLNYNICYYPSFVTSFQTDVNATSQGSNALKGDANCPL